MLLRWRAGGSPRLLKASRTTYYALAYAHSAARPSQSLRKSQFKEYPVIRDSMRMVIPGQKRPLIKLKRRKKKKKENFIFPGNVATLARGR